MNLQEVVCVCVCVCVCRMVWTRFVWPSIRPVVDFVKTELKLWVAYEAQIFSTS